jgi:hypothetical protein
VDETPPQPGRPPRLLGAASVALLAAALAFHAVPFPWPTNRFDTGVHLCAAELLRAGRAPYIDFQTLYTPGSYHLLAWAFGLFGSTFDVHSRLDAVLLALNAWTAWHVAARCGAGRAGALVAFAAGVAFTYPYPSLLLALLAVVCAVRPKGRAPWVRAAVAGAVAGLAGWFRQDLGAVATIAAAVAVAASAEGASVRRRAVLSVTVGAIAAVVLALLLAPALAAAPHRVWEGLVLNPLATVPYRDSGHALDDAARDAAFGVPMLAAVLATGAAGVGAWFARRRGDATACGALAGLAIVAVWAVRYVVLRAETHHLVPAGIVGAVVLASVAPVAPSQGRGRWIGRALLVVAGLAVALPLARGAAARAAHVLGRRADATVGVGELLPGAAALHLPPADGAAWIELVRRLRARLGPGDALLSACSRHDVIQDQDLLLYFAVGRLPPVYDYHFDPGVTTREDVQRGIVADAERADVRVVVRYDSRNARVPPGAPAGSRFLDGWIDANFRREERIGRYEIWSRR